MAPTYTAAALMLLSARLSSATVMHFNGDEAGSISGEEAHSPVLPRYVPANIKYAAAMNNKREAAAEPEAMPEPQSIDWASLLSSLKGKMSSASTPPAGGSIAVPTAGTEPTPATPVVPPSSGAAGGGAAPALSTTFPTPKGTVRLSAPKTITGSFDGGMQLFDRSSNTCKGQEETGDKDAVFLVADGGTVSNVIIGPNNGEGIHCQGSCTLENVWWQDVCEDAATFKQKSGTSYVKGGGARKASDKVFQHNGGGTVNISNFYAEDIGKLYRSCGNCGTQYARTVIMDNVVVKKGKLGAGVNGNLGDKAIISNSCFQGGDICNLFRGVRSGEPTKTGTAPDGKTCATTAVRRSC